MYKKSPYLFSFNYWINKTQDKLSVISLILVVALMPYDKIYINIAGIHINLPDIIIIIYFIFTFIRFFNIKNSIYTINSNVFIAGLFIYIYAIVSSSLISDLQFKSFIFISSIFMKISLLYMGYSVFKQGYSSLFGIAIVYIMTANFISLWAIMQFIRQLFDGILYISISGPFYNRNSMVFYLVPAAIMAIPFNTYKNYFKKSTIKLINISILTIFISIALSFGRVGLVTLLLFSLLSFYIYGRLKSEMVSIILIVGISSLLLKLNYPVIYERLFVRYNTLIEIQDTLDSDASQLTRYNVFTLGLNYFQNNMWFGIGPGLFRNKSITIGENKVPAHNTYLGVLVETGLIGISGLILMLSAGYIRVLSKLRYFYDRRIAISILFVYSSCLFQAIFYDAIGLYQIWIFLSACFGIVSANNKIMYTINYKRNICAY
jgi:O-antigen ligase